MAGRYDPALTARLSTSRLAYARLSDWLNHYEFNWGSELWGRRWALIIYSAFHENISSFLQPSTESRRVVTLFLAAARLTHISHAGLVWRVPSKLKNSLSDSVIHDHNKHSHVNMDHIWITQFYHILYNFPQQRPSLPTEVMPTT